LFYEEWRKELRKEGPEFWRKNSKLQKIDKFEKHPVKNKLKNDDEPQ